ncbi:SusD/RagB family nutrient-binding outer membrane lipoprotein [Sediminibacterium sp.]|uniref:SusD/RagB family nutrient-binding outer membrane lipoprotein n=1 Tax=Sediminibacterium sp. TaxID=1917865 RepID=UPI0025F6B9BB|nr:SusD/RagB family nutrient-binding outer membrane lipoprotein [Sediminibacterium sp.]MBW0177765.1 SusD/RagB family nutrient-binding outer membrane lipoprotein [Sediminibacterium sp.]
MKNKFLIIGSLSLLTLGSCTKNFEKINTNPNVPSSVTPDLLLSGVIKNTINDQVNEAWGIGNIVAQHTAKIQFVNEDRYLWGERNGVWNSVYGNMRNVQNMIDLATASTPVQNNYLGVALIMKSWMFSLATDAYGDIPYTEATKAKTGSVYTPKYDKQEDIYTGLLADLKKANDILGTSSEAISGDILYNGSVDKWRRLANSLRLRLLMRLSKKKNVNADMQAIVGNPTTNPIFSSNSDNAELKYLADVPANQWPLYSARVGSFDEFRVSKTLSDRLTVLNDPRLAVFGRPSQKSVAAGTPKIEGIPNGLGDVAALNYNGGPQGVSRVGYSYACLVCNDGGQIAPQPNVARGLIMTYAELQFILAEAAEKGMITSATTPEDYYLRGIQANFSFYNGMIPSQYGINVTPPAGYYTQAGVAYAGTQTEKLEKIALQKWVALFFNGLEAWFDWRRTGMPAIIPGADNLNNNKVPLRYIYPLSEQSLNGKNRTEAVARQGADDLNTAIWIIK